MTLCASCVRSRIVTSGKGSRFILCERSLEDSRYPKYPPQPLLRCEGFVLLNSGTETQSILPTSDDR